MWWRCQAAADAGADAIITSNYGEAGALDRFGSGGVPVVSGHVQLWHLDRPPGDAETVVLVGGQSGSAQHWFASCSSAAELEKAVGVDTEEQGEPVPVCSGPQEPWPQLWTRFRHLD